MPPNTLFPMGRWAKGCSRETSGLNMDIKMLRDGITGPFTVCLLPHAWGLKNAQ